MSKLSQHYRNDNIEDLDENIKDYLDEHYFSRLTHLSTPNPKLLVVFSGGNAMGKTTIASEIRDECGALVLENDAVKRQLLEMNPDLDRDSLNQLTWQYTMNLYGRLDNLTPNGLVVRDGVIDWYFDRILPVFEKAGYPIFIIGFDITRQKAIELIEKRGDTPTVKEERFYKLLGDHEVHIKRFRENYTPDVTLTDSNVFDHNLILSVLKQRLKELSNNPGSA